MARPKLEKVRLDRLNVPQPAIRTGRRRLAELVASVDEVGILVPLVVREIGGGEYVVLGGAGRLEALRLTGAGPATRVPCVVVDVDDAEAMLLALVDNVVREEMRPFDEAETARTLVEEYGYEQQRVAAALGVSPTTISLRLAVFRLDPKVVAAVRKDQVALRVALALLPFEDDRPAQRRLLKRIVAEGLTAAEVKGLVAAERFGKKAVAPVEFEVRGAGT
ncbi:MAG: ParB/RepB/Spo0J family partition protein, partial [Polyangiaceae bacterium]